MRAAADMDRVVSLYLSQRQGRQPARNLDNVVESGYGEG